MPKQIEEAMVEAAPGAIVEAPVLKAKEYKAVPLMAKKVVDTAKLTSAKQKEVIAALLEAHPDIAEKLGL